VKRTLQVRRNDEVEAQRRRWTFYETINVGFRDTASRDDFTLSRRAWVEKNAIPKKNFGLQIWGVNLYNQTQIFVTLWFFEEKCVSMAEGFQGPGAKPARLKS